MLILIMMSLTSSCKNMFVMSNYCLIDERITLIQKDLVAMSIDTKRQILNHNQKYDEICH